MSGRSTGWRQMWWVAAVLGIAAGCAAPGGAAPGPTAAPDLSSPEPSLSPSATTPPSAPSTSSSVGATTTVSGVAASTTSAPPPTLPTDSRFAPACVDRSATGSGMVVDETVLDTLQPLGAEPVVQVELPRTVDGAGTVDWTRGGPIRIPGGMLLVIWPAEARTVPFGMLTAVNADGSVRWQRCFDPLPIVHAADGGSAEEFVLEWRTPLGSGLDERRFEVWSLADGAPSRTWDDMLAASGVTGEPVGYRTSQWLLGSSALLVLGPDDGRVAEASDRLLVVDLDTMQARTLPYPPTAIGDSVDSVLFEVSADGRLVEIDDFDSVTPGGRVWAVETPAGWSTATADLEAAAGLEVWFDYRDGRPGLVGSDPSGGELWRRDDLFRIPFEGFTAGVDGDVALVVACSEPPPTDIGAERQCPGQQLLAVEAASGRTLWQRDGAWAVSVIGDGRALVSGPYAEIAVEGLLSVPPWQLIDLATGEQVGTGTWGAPWRFGIGCCDSPETASIEGGVVFTVGTETVEMWYPEQMTTPLRRVSLG